MKNFLMVTTVQNTIEAFLIPHIKMLEKNGYKVHIATNICREIPEELKSNKWFNISFSRNPFSKNSLKAIKEMRSLLRKNEFEIVHLHTPVAGFLGRYAAIKEKQKNIIYTAHGFHFFRGAPLLNWLLYYPIERLAARWTDKLITINNEDFEIAKEIGSKRAEILKIDGVGLMLDKYKNGNKTKVKAELEIKDNEFVISIIGELNKNKNQIQLLKAVELLNTRGIKGLRVILAGIGNQEKKLKEFILEKNIKANLLGHRDDIEDIILASDLLCSMSYREGLPRNIMEGMTQGKPFIATNIRGNRDIIKNGMNGFLVSVNDFENTAKCIQKLLENKSLRKDIEKNNTLDVEKFSIEKILKSMREIYGQTK